MITGQGQLVFWIQKHYFSEGEGLHVILIITL